MPKAVFFCLFFYLCRATFAQEDPNIWAGGGIYTPSQPAGNMLKAVGGEKKIVLQISGTGEVTGTLEAVYDRSKASGSFRVETADQTFLLGGRYDSSRNLLLLVITHLKAANSAGADRPFRKPDSVYYTTTIGKQQGRVEMTGSAHPVLTRNTAQEWVGASRNSMETMATGGSQTMHILPLNIRLEKFVPFAEPAVPYTPPATTAPPVQQAPVEKRKTEIQHTIVLDTSLVKLDMYDNGEVDGDIATLILDGNVIVNSQLLSTKAVSVTLNISKDQPEHLLELYANNLGSIPPNTALLVITCNRKRYEINLSSNGSSNGTVKLTFAKR